MHNTIEVKIFNKKDLIAQITKIRGRLTQEQFAERLGVYGVKVSRSKVSRWEDGVSEPSASELAAIAAFAGCSIDEVVYGREIDVSEGMASKIAKQVVSQLNILGNHDKNMSYLNSGWNQKHVRRARSLMQRSLNADGHPSLKAALAAKGLTGNYSMLQNILDGITGEYALSQDQVRAIALICRQVVGGWDGNDEPNGVTDSNYGESVDLLLRDIMNGNNCRA